MVNRSDSRLTYPWPRSSLRYRSPSSSVSRTTRDVIAPSLISGPQAEIPVTPPRFGSKNEPGRPPFSFGLENLAGTPPSVSGSNNKPSPTTIFSLLAQRARDSPIPSVENDSSSANFESSISSTRFFTPSASFQGDPPEQSVAHDSVLETLGGFDLRLTSPVRFDQAPSRDNTTTPRVQITEPTHPEQSDPMKADDQEEIISGINALRVASSGRASVEPPEAHRSRDSPSPLRRRSGSRATIQKHRVEDEAPPEAASRISEVEEALATARTLTSGMATALSSATHHLEDGSIVERLYRQADLLSKFQLQSARTVGLVGDPGVGKSSLINCLLDTKGLAFTLNNGSACTCTVTEFLFHDRDDFVIHVDLFSTSELRKQFEQLLRALRDSSGDHLSGISPSDLEDLLHTADLARQTFHACFRERLAEMPNLLSSMDFEHAVTQMVEWVSQILPLEVCAESFNTMEACSSRLRDLTSDNGERSLGGDLQIPWPFIRKVQVHLKAYVLSKGLIIADLPGLRDLNSARKAITERYIRQCHQIFVVAGIGRANDSASIKEIFELAGRVKLSNIDIVCTKSDELDVSEALQGYRIKDDFMKTRQLEISRYTIEMQDLQEQLFELKEEFESFNRNDQYNYVDLDRQLQKTRTLLEQTEFDLRSHLIVLRNTEVAVELKKLYQKYPSMRVFCVSKHLYWKRRDQDVTSAIPCLQLSGILDLRQFCIGIVAQSRIQAITSFVKDDLPAFLGSVGLWVGSGSSTASAESTRRTFDVVTSIERGLDKLTSPRSQIKLLSQTLHTLYREQINSHMQQNELLWSRDAEIASLKWSGLHPSSYKAFCSKFGDHAPRYFPPRRWNEEAMQSMKDDISFAWESFCTDLGTKLELIELVVSDTFDTISAIALSASEMGLRGTVSHVMSDLVGILYHRKRSLLFEIEKAFEIFNGDLRTLQDNAFSSAQSCFFGSLMENTYHMANQEYGNGSDQKRKNIITNRFKSRSLFSHHRVLCQEAFRSLAIELERQVNDIVNLEIRMIEADLQILKGQNMIPEWERDSAFKDRVKLELTMAQNGTARISRLVQDVS